MFQSAVLVHRWTMLEVLVSFLIHAHPKLEQHSKNSQIWCRAGEATSRICFWVGFARVYESFAIAFSNLYCVSRGWCAEVSSWLRYGGSVSNLYRQTFRRILTMTMSFASRGSCTRGSLHTTMSPKFCQIDDITGAPPWLIHARS